MIDVCVSVLKNAPEPLPAWAVEAAASAPRISPVDAAPLVSIFILEARHE